MNWQASPQRFGLLVREIPQSVHKLRYGAVSSVTLAFHYSDVQLGKGYIAKASQSIYYDLNIQYLQSVLIILENE
jgi:hypothetical protein